MKLSVIIPMYNAASFLEAAIHSVLEQSRVPDEVIVVDDGSTDESAAIAAAIADLTLIKSPHRGPATARNIGIRAASGALLAFHDADDLCAPQRFERQIDTLLESDAAFCLCLLENFVEEGYRVPEVRMKELEQASRLGFVSSGVFHRSAFDTVGLFDESYLQGEDVEWLYRAQRKAVEQVLCPEVLIRRRLHEHNSSHAYTLGHKNLFRMIRESRKDEES